EVLVSEWRCNLAVLDHLGKAGTVRFHQLQDAIKDSLLQSLIVIAASPPAMALPVAKGLVIGGGDNLCGGRGVRSALERREGDQRMRRAAVGGEFATLPVHVVMIEGGEAPPIFTADANALEIGREPKVAGDAGGRRDAVQEFAQTLAPAPLHIGGK